MFAALRRLFRHSRPVADDLMTPDVLARLIEANTARGLADRAEPEKPLIKIKNEHKSLDKIVTYREDGVRETVTLSPGTSILVPGGTAYVSAMASARKRAKAKRKAA